VVFPTGIDEAGPVAVDVYYGAADTRSRARQIHAAKVRLIAASRPLAVPGDKTTTPKTAGASRPQPNVRLQRASSDVSINDYSWAASPHIYRTLFFSQTSPCLRGASNSNVCRTAETGSQLA
jgi:hypothetical protein